MFHVSPVGTPISFASPHSACAWDHYVVTVVGCVVVLSCESEFVRSLPGSARELQCVCSCEEALAAGEGLVKNPMVLVWKRGDGSPTKLVHDEWRAISIVRFAGEKIIAVEDNPVNQKITIWNWHSGDRIWEGQAQLLAKGLILDLCISGSRVFHIASSPTSIFSWDIDDPENATSVFSSAQLQDPKWRDAKTLFFRLSVCKNGSVFAASKEGIVLRINATQVENGLKLENRKHPAIYAFATVENRLFIGNKRKIRIFDSNLRYEKCVRLECAPPAAIIKVSNNVWIIDEKCGVTLYEEGVASSGSDTETLTQLHSPLCKPLPQAFASGLIGFTEYVLRSDTRQALFVTPIDAIAATKAPWVIVATQSGNLGFYDTRNPGVPLEGEELHVPFVKFLALGPYHVETRAHILCVVQSSGLSLWSFRAIAGHYQLTRLPNMELENITVLQFTSPESLVLIAAERLMFWDIAPKLEKRKVHVDAGKNHWRGLCRYKSLTVANIPERSLIAVFDDAYDYGQVHGQTFVKWFPDDDRFSDYAAICHHFYIVPTERGPIALFKYSRTLVSYIRSLPAHCEPCHVAFLNNWEFLTISINTGAMLEFKLSEVIDNAKYAGGRAFNDEISKKNAPQETGVSIQEEDKWKVGTSVVGSALNSISQIDIHVFSESMFENNGADFHELSKETLSLSATMPLVEEDNKLPQAGALNEKETESDTSSAPRLLPLFSGSPSLKVADLSESINSDKMWAAADMKESRNAMEDEELSWLGRNHQHLGDKQLGGLKSTRKPKEIFLSVPDEEEGPRVDVMAERNMEKDGDKVKLSVAESWRLCSLEEEDFKKCAVKEAQSLVLMGSPRSMDEEPANLDPILSIPSSDPWSKKDNEEVASPSEWEGKGASVTMDNSLTGGSAESETPALKSLARKELTKSEKEEGNVGENKEKAIESSGRADAQSLVSIDGTHVIESKQPLALANTILADLSTLIDDAEKSMTPTLANKLDEILNLVDNRLRNLLYPPCSLLKSTSPE